MAHIQRRIRNGAVRWVARSSLPSGREISRTFKRKIDAERWMATTEAAKLRGDWVDPAAGKVRTGEWAPRWLETKRNLKPKTRHSYRSLLDSLVLPRFEDVPLNRIDRAQVEAWVADLEGRGLSASRIHQGYNVLAQVLDAAMANGMLARNVARGVELPRITTRERRFLTAGQVAALADAIDVRYRPFILVLAYGGLRWGEAVAIRRRRVDLLRRRIEVAEAVTEVNGTPIWGTPKTHQARSVTLPRVVCDDLARHLERIEEDPDALVFPAPKGGVLRHPAFMRRQWRPALNVAKLPENLTPHELRHTCAALLIAQGADPKAVQAQLGHSSIMVTFDVYGHLFDGHLDDVMDRLDAAHRDSETGLRRDGGDFGPLGTAP